MEAQKKKDKRTSEKTLRTAREASYFGKNLAVFRHLTVIHRQRTLKSFPIFCGFF